MAVQRLSQQAALCLGYGLFFSVCPLGPLGTALLRQGALSWDGILFVRLAFLACGSLCALGLSANPRTLPRNRRLCMAVGVAAQGVLLAGYALGAGAWTVPSCAIVSGIFAGAYQLSWAELLSRVYAGAGRAASISVYALAFVFSTALSAAEPLVQMGGIASAATVLTSCLAAWALLEAARKGTGVQDAPLASEQPVPHMPIYARSVLVSLGVTWALAFNLAVDLGFGSSDTADAASWVTTLAVYGVCQLAVIVLVKTTRLGAAHFGLMLRWVVVFVGIAWAFMPVLVAHAPRLACAVCVMAFLMQSVIVMQFTIEACHERAIPFLATSARYAGAFVLAACAGSLAFLAIKTGFSSWTLHSLTAAAAVSVSLLVVPMLPSRSGGAGMFMFDTLPEDESIDGRVEHAKQELATESGLTARETEVLDLMLAGLSRDDIAQRLALSSWTVKNHCRSIYAKTGTHSAKELMGQIYGNR